MMQINFIHALYSCCKVNVMFENANLLCCKSLCKNAIVISTEISEKT